MCVAARWLVLLTVSPHMWIHRFLFSSSRAPSVGTCSSSTSPARTAKSSGGAAVPPQLCPHFNVTCKGWMCNDRKLVPPLEPPPFFILLHGKWQIFAFQAVTKFTDLRTDDVLSVDAEEPGLVCCVGQQAHLTFQHLVFALHQVSVLHLRAVSGMVEAPQHGGASPLPPRGPLLLRLPRLVHERVRW